MFRERKAGKGNLKHLYRLARRRREVERFFKFCLFGFSVERKRKYKS